MELLFLTILYTILTIIGLFDHSDEVVNHFLEDIATSEIITLSKGVTFLAHTEMLFILSVVVGIFLLLKKQKRELFSFVVVMSVGVITTFLMKIMIERDRPGEVSYVDFWGYGGEIISYSYPSGHAIKSLMLFGFLILYIKKHIKTGALRNSAIVLFSFIILFNGIGQMILEKHYLSDIIGGYLLGFTLLYFLKEYLLKTKKEA